MDVGAMHRRLKQAALEACLPYNGIHTIHNTRLAQEMSAWAYTIHTGNVLHELVFAANFVDGKNISDPEVLEAIAVSAGLDGKTAADVLKKRSFTEVVDRDWAVARERDISVAPTLMLGQERLVGARPYEAMARLMEKHGGKKRAGVA
jgi:predicted DsbA family dithiol-disulfide isomerase